MYRVIKSKIFIFWSFILFLLFVNQKCNMFFLELPFVVRHIYFRKEGGGGVMYSTLIKITDPVLILRSLDPLEWKSHMPGGTQHKVELVFRVPLPQFWS